MAPYPILLAVSFACVVAAVIWARSALRLERSWRRLLEGSGPTGSMAVSLAQSFASDPRNAGLVLLADLARRVPDVRHGPRRYARRQ